MTSYTKRSTTPANFTFGPFCRHRSRAVNKRTGAKYRRRLCVAAYNLLSLLRVADIGRDEKAGRLENFKPSQWPRERKNGAVNRDDSDGQTSFKRFSPTVYLFRRSVTEISKVLKRDWQTSGVSALGFRSYERIPFIRLKPVR